MAFSLPQFNGFLEHKVDPKYRIAIPAAWRKGEEEQLVLQELSKYGVKFIRVMTLQALEEAVTAIKNHNSSTVGEIRDALEQLYVNILTVNLNAQGKLLIPKEWSIRANIEAESTVILAGRGEYFDIYNPQGYAMIDQNQKSRVLESMADLCIFSS